MVQIFNRRKTTQIVAITILALATSPSFASTACEETFHTVGDVRNGLAYFAQRTIPKLSIDSALGQVRYYATGKKFVVGADSIEGNLGKLYLTPAGGDLPMVLTFTASPEGRVKLAGKLARGEKLDLERSKQSMCNILDDLKAGKEGEAVAKKGRAGSDAGSVTEITAVELSRILGKEAKKIDAAMNKGATFKDMFFGSHTSRDKLHDRASMMMPLTAKYVGRKYRIDGEVYTASFNHYSGEGDVAWLVTKNRGLIGVREDDDLNNFQFTVTCVVAQDQLPFVASLRSHDFAKLEGTVDSIDLSGIRLKECRQVDDESSTETTVR